MYEQFYGLTERPFDLTPDWRYLYLTPMHREALGGVQYGITARRGIVVVIGEAGTGKTTVVRSALHALRTKNVRHVYLSNPMLTRPEFMRFLAQAFKLSPGSASDKTVLLSELTAKLTRHHNGGRAIVLVVDEAQSMPHELFEEIRLLANIETRTAKLLQVVILGQPELAARLNDASLRQLKQRVAIRSTLKPLDLRSTAAMIAGRIRVAGGKPAETFTPRAVELVYLHSGGVPRTINVICDNALLSGFGADVKPVSSDLVEEVCREFDLPRQVELPTVEAHPAGHGANVAAPHAPATLQGPPPAPPRPVAAEAPPNRPVPVEAPAIRPATKVAAPAVARHDIVIAGTPRPVTAAPAAAPSKTTAAPAVSDTSDLFPAYGKRRRSSLFNWVRG
jgi:general secretion pathway protein A